MKIADYRMSEQDALDLREAVNECYEAGYAVWHIGHWPTRGWNANLYKISEQAGGATETRSGNTPAEAVRNALRLPDRTPDELLADKVSAEFSRADLLKASVRLKAATVNRLLAALAENARVRADRP